MIQDEYIKFETAKLLKEKGFDEKCGYCYAFFDEDDIRVLELKHHISGLSLAEKRYPYVTQSVAMKWLRKEHKIGIFPRQYHIYKDNAVSDEFGYGVEIIKLGTDIPLNPNGEKISDKDRYFISASYEQACEAAIKYCLINLI